MFTLKKWLCDCSAYLVARQVPKAHNRRLLQFQCFESRFNFSAEGAAFDLTQSFDVSGILGNPVATIDWGDGSTPTQATVTSNTSSGNIKLRFDYSLDTSGFFNDASRRAALELAGRMAASRFTDSLSAITPTGTNTWSAVVINPSTGNQLSIDNPTIAANEIVVYAGSRNLGGTTLALGGPGGQSARGTQQWLDNVFGRGETGAIGTAKTDVAPWGGAITFNPTTNWYFGVDPAGLTSDKMDFYTVATHELTHLLGFGTAESWNNLKSGGSFTGAKSRAAYDAGGNVPLSTDGSHWLETITEGGQKTMMGPIIQAGKRELTTALDLAGMDDIGWDVVNTSASLNASHVYPDNGTYNITISIAGSSLGTLSLTSSATVTNVAPTLTVPENQVVTTGDTIRFTNIGSISDPGFTNSQGEVPTVETFTYSINWGDGSAVDTGTAQIDRNGSATQATLASFDGSHRYTQPGNYSVTVRVTDDDGASTQKTFQVSATAPPELTLTLNRSSVVESGGADAATLTIARSGATSNNPITVQLSSNDTSEITVPATVVIPAGTSSVTVPVTAVDDNLLDGSQTVTLTASAPSTVGDSMTLTVTDEESLTATLTAASIREDAAADSFFMTVARSNTDTNAALTVSILGNDPTQFTMPLTIVIPAGQQSVQLPIVPVNDTIAELQYTARFRLVATVMSNRPHY